MKILASDYDGTIRYGNEVMEEDIDAIRRWREAGNLFVMATGRSFESIKKEVDEHNIPVDYYVTNNGGVVFDGEGNQLFASYLEYITSLDIMYIAKEMDGVVSYVVNDGMNRHRVIVNPDYDDKRYPDLEPDLSEDEVMDLGKYAQIVISMIERGMAKSLADGINSHFADIVVAYANNYVVDIVPRGTSKATGLEFVCEMEDVSEYDTYTIGDSYNDIPLMEYGLNGACIASAFEDVKDHAQKTYGSIKEMVDEIL